ncbi:hypothetical protein TWF703_005180 [Orbilia oligospora]|uniref:Uncharacterized protein n=1 Tax=Orbilia oligospora TaxID=2813651 RepID=A0A7C8P7F8_ORBOL|nr:hypothetical protein TWF703_005180 [Orbilia oligospora]
MSEQSSQRVNSNARGPKGGSLHTTPSLQSLGEVVSPLLRVPREIRNEIYKYLLYFPLPPLPGPVPVREWDEIRRLERRPSQFEDPNRNIDILRVNKQIHAEATEFLYSVNVFLIQITTSVAQEDINGHGLSSGDPTVLLEEALKPVAESVAVEIIVASLDSKGSEEFQIETPKAYAELIETLWPLTAGPWKYTITLPVSIQQRYGYLTDSILESCNREVVVTKGEENHFLKVEIDHSRYLRVRNRGIHVLDHADYFPRYAKSEPYTMHICRRPSKGKLTSKVTEPTSSSPGAENASKRSSRLWGSIAQGTRRAGDKIRQRVSELRKTID